MGDYSTRDVKLQKIKIGLETALSDEMLDDVDVYDDILYGMVRAQVRAYVWAEQEHQKEQVVTWPADWWQAFKERWLPKWALKRWPVEYRTVRFSVSVLYPELRVAMPNHTAVFMVNREDWN